MEPAESLANQPDEEIKVQKETLSEPAQQELKATLNVKDGADINIIKEGKAKIYVKEYKTDTKNNATYEQEVFYNPVQIFNRDLTIFVIKTYAESRREKEKEKFQGIKILDALAATGLRTIRFMSELDPSLVSSFHTNDLDENAIKFIRKNFELNQLDQSKITLTHSDANVLMYNSKDTIMKNQPKPLKYDVIDLDPYGSAVPFLDTAVQAVAEGGLLCVTCTDMRVLGGSDYGKCFYMYGVSRPKIHCFQENALRIILYSISSIANKYCRYIKPLVSYQSEYYLRVFVTVHNGRQECQKSFLKYGNVYYCMNCGNYHVHQLGRMDGNVVTHNKLKFDFSNCDQCDNHFSMNGPIWINPLNDLSFVQTLYDKIQEPDFNLDLKAKKKIYGMLHGILQEKETGNTPLSVSVEKISQLMKVSVPGQHIFAKVLNDHGFSVAPSYVHPNLWKTNAPLSLLYDMVRVWRKESLAKENADPFRSLEPGSAGYICFAKPVKHEINLEGAQRSKAEKVPMFFPNPEKNWGPKKRAAAKKLGGGDEQEGENKIEEEKEEVQNDQNNEGGVAGDDNEEDDETREKIEKKVKYD